MPIFAIVAIGLCVWRCRKKGAQAPDMFLGALALLGISLAVDLHSIAEPINTSLGQLFSSAKNVI
ncbi:hypothetical protein [Frankia sp. R82]|uniref:hypothetical protein n=1 Tax=Frankia sp. R82 TaxID=2950553 RepID=UPI002042CFDB|nr:hypothetical protein [Frankia sp. R82]MCM3884155.1 hypothetical protein [Frankia sp. R82]